MSCFLFITPPIHRHGTGRYKDADEEFEGMWKHDVKEDTAPQNPFLVAAIKGSGNKELKMATASDCILTGEDRNP